MDLEKKAIDRIKLASDMSLGYYGKPLICTYSGGKDSDVMLELFKRSGVPFEVLHSHTTADAPQTVYHIREVFYQLELQGIKCDIDFHVQPDGSRITMWNLIPRKLMPPTRLVRYCCSVLKETGGKNRMIATGVRWAESKARNDRAAYEALARSKDNKVRVSDEKMLLTDNDDTRKLFEKCQMKAKTVVNPIIDWKNNDVLEYAESEKIRLNTLYSCGYGRVGCIGCPMAGKHRSKEFADFPTFKMAYIKAFDKMILERKKRNLPTVWKTGVEAFHWWIEDPNIFGQLSFEDFPEIFPDGY